MSMTFEERMTLMVSLAVFLSSGIAIIFINYATGTRVRRMETQLCRQLWKFAPAATTTGT